MGEVFAFLAFYHNQDYKSENITFKAKINPLQIMATSIQKTNAKNLADFLSTFQLIIEKPKMYKQVMSKTYT